MTRLVLPQMLERGKGAIINMASGASCQPTPQMNVYAATKVGGTTSGISIPTNSAGIS